VDTIADERRASGRRQNSIEAISQPAVRMYRPLQSWSARMSVTIGEITSEVIVEPERQLGGGIAPANQLKDLATIRAELAAIARLARRTRAEGFDD
jgi:hypothetical protein